MKVNYDSGGCGHGFWHATRRPSSEYRGQTQCGRAADELCGRGRPRLEESLWKPAATPDGSRILGYYLCNRSRAKVAKLGNK